MNLSALLFIILAYWIFVLQNKIKELEKIVHSLKDSGEDSKLKVSLHVPTVEKTVPETQKFKSDNQPEAIDVKEYIKPIRTYKQTDQEPISQELSKAVTFITNYFTGGNLLVRIGGVILFFGLAFLVKYAAEHSIISIEMRLIAVAVAAVVLIVIGWRLRDREGAYGQILQGLGVAMFYLVIYAASKFYALLTLDIAFILMLLVVILGSALAVIEDSLPLALFSTAGGFLVPILTSTESGSHILLFSYYVLLNLGIFIVAWYRSWRVLNVVGFVFTFVIATVWGVLKYRSEMFDTTEPFLILYFLMYLTISILFTTKHTFKPKNLVDGTLVFGLPIIAFPLQVNLVKAFAYGEAYSAFVLASLYLILFWFLKNKERTRLLAHSFLTLSVVFYTITIPYIFDADVSAALWSLESAGIIWIALKQKKPYTLFFGELLLLASIFIYPHSVYEYRMNLAEYLGYIIVITAALISAYLLDRYKEQLTIKDFYLTRILVGSAIVLWFISTPMKMMTYIDVAYANAMLFSLILGACILFFTTKVIHWKLIIVTLQGYLLLGIIFFFLNMMEGSHFIHPFEGYGAISLGLMVLINYLLLHHYDTVWKFTREIHIASLWFITFILTLELHYQAEHLSLDRSLIMISIALTPLVFSIFLLTPKRYIAWLETYRNSYQFIGVGGFIAMLFIWEFKAFAVAPHANLTYIPLLNPLDIMQGLVILITYYWIAKNKTSFEELVKVSLYGMLALLSTIFASVVFARAVHIYREINYRFYTLWEHIYFQAGLSILWSTIAIILMLLSKRYNSRPLWLTGFGLLILVVLKLFFIELASSGTIERVISFLVVGTLLLLIGYFVPLPPNENEEKKNI
jgi:uncharacterized membrane protein